MASGPAAGREDGSLSQAGPAFGPALLRGAGGALVGIGLAVPILAIRTDQSPDGLLLTLRPHLVTFAAATGFGFALAHALGFRRPVEAGGAGPAAKALALGFVALALALGYVATLLAAPPVAAWLLPGVAVSFTSVGLWINLSLGLLAALLLLAILPAGTGSAARRDRKVAVTTSADPGTQSGAALSAFLSPALLGVALLFPAAAVLLSGGLSESRYWVDLGILILTYVMLGWGLNIVVGLAGLLDLGYVAFYAVGAYSYALLAQTFGLSFWVCLPLAGILAAFWGILLGFPVLRLRGDYLAIVTLAFGEIIRLVLINWVDVTGGGAGISSIPRATFFGIPFTADENGFAARFGLTFSPMHRILFLYYLILVLALLTNVVTIRLRRLPVGRAWEALREDEIACRSLGINTTMTKLTAFAIGAMFGGFAGSFFAVRQGFISPESFNFLESATILAVVVLGGMGSQIGVAIAAILMVGAPELLRNLDVLKSVFGPGFDPNEYRLLLFGLAMVAMMIWRPRGLISVREPSVVLRERKAISGSLVREGHG